jgi:hypothetical protein
MNSVHNSHPISGRLILILSSRLRLCLPSVPLSYFYAFLISHMRAICPSHLTLLDFITLIKYDDNSWQGSDGIFLCATTSRPTSEPSQPPIQSVPGALSPEV